MGDQNIDMLPLYYKRLFPYSLYFKWLTYGNVQENYFHNREFSFTLADDVYIRYQSFTDQANMEEEIKKLCPHKIDIGAVYNYRPKAHRTLTHFIPLEKELVFDIDMTDYDEVRNCCQGADICTKCWKFMVVAIKVLDAALREDFGFQHLLWVFSGRRGVHCWVCDETARSLSQPARSAIAEYLQVIKGGEQLSKKVTLNYEIHPAIDRAVKTIDQYFSTMMLEDQDCLGSDTQVKQFLLMVPDEQLRSKLETEMLRYTKSTDRWKVFEEMGINSKKRQGAHLKEEIMLQLIYPRLDINVTKQLNHLLKSPFCVHPKTGKVCVPIDPKNAEHFNPETVPTLHDLVAELDEEISEEKKKIANDYERTSLNSSFQFFKKFLIRLENSSKQKSLSARDGILDF